MKVNLGPLEPQSLPNAPGAFYLRDTRWGVVAQAWPKKSTRPPTLLEHQHRTRFGFAGRMAASPFWADFQTAIEMSRGTEQVPRDILTMAALGRYYTIINPDGSVWGHVAGSIK